MTANTSRSHRKYVVQLIAPGVCAALAVLLVYVIATLRGGELWDDSFMFLRYARHLLDGHGLSWNYEQGPEFGLTSLGYLFLTLPVFAVTAHASALALSICSVICGIFFVGAALYLGFNQPQGQNRSLRLLCGLFVAVCLATTAPELSAHFTSGMDTTLGMLWITLTLLLFRRRLNDSSNCVSLTLGIVAGLTFSVRPDALILVAPLVFFFLFQSTPSQTKQRTLPLLAFGVAVLSQLLVSWAYFGQLLPNPFYVKSGSHYGMVFQDFYQGLGLHYLLLFLSSIPWVCAALLTQLCLCRHSMTTVQILLLGGVTLFLGYHSVFVTPIMGFHARFLFPALPLLLWIGADSVAALCNLIGQRGERVQKLVDYRLPILFLPLVVVASALKPTEVIEKFSSINLAALQLSQWDLSTIYRERFTKSWAGLDAVAALPGEIGMAGTEVGLLGALNLDRNVVDLTGLQDRRFLGPFSAQVLLNLAPDLIYMPFPHYAEMLAAIEAAPEFQAEYQYFSAAALDTRFGVAVLKKSTYFSLLAPIFERLRESNRIN